MRHRELTPLSQEEEAPLLPSSLSSSCSLSNAESLGRASPDAASSRSCSPVTFMSDSNLSPPRSPAPSAAARDVSLGGSGSRGAVPALVPLTEAFPATDDDDEEKREPRGPTNLTAADPIGAAGAAILSFASSMFSTTTNTTTESSSPVSFASTPASPRASLSSQSSDSTTRDDVSQVDELTGKPSQHTLLRPTAPHEHHNSAVVSPSTAPSTGGAAARKGTGLTASRSDDSLRTTVLLGGVSATSELELTASGEELAPSPPDSHRSSAVPTQVLQEGGVSFSAAAPASAGDLLHRDASLLRLASRLPEEALQADAFLSPTRSCIHTTEISWVPSPLPEAKQKRTARRGSQWAYDKARERKSSSTASRDLSPEVSVDEAEVRCNGALLKTARRGKRRRAKAQTAPPTAATSTSTTVVTTSASLHHQTSQNSADGAACRSSPVLASESAVKKPPPPPPLQEDLDELLALLYGPDAKKASHSRRRERKKPRGEAAVLAPVDADFGEFSMEDWALPNRVTASADKAGANVLSQPSFLMPGDGDSATDGAKVGPPAKQRRRSARRQTTKGVAVAAEESGRIAPTTHLLPDPIREGPAASLDALRGDELIVALHWGGVEAAVAANLLPPPPQQATTAAAPPARAKRRSRKRPRPLSRDPHSADAAAAAAEGPINTTPTAEAHPLSWWAATQAAASLPASERGRPCLWVEVPDTLQETRAALLRQLLVYWGCLHRNERSTRQSAAPPPPPSSSSSTSPAMSQTRTREKGGSADAAAALTSPAACCDGEDVEGSDGVVVLLCPPSASLEAELRWWVQCAHAAHGFVPPLFAVAMSVVDSTGQTCSCTATSPFTAGDLMAQAVLHASCDMQLDPCRSLAVTWSSGGAAAMAQILPASHVYSSPESCAAMLSTHLPFSLPAQLLDSAGSPARTAAVDAGSLAAVMATMTAFSVSAPPVEATEEERFLQPLVTASLQDSCFDALCKWNGLAVELRDRPRRPQLLLHRVRVGAVFDASSADLVDSAAATEKEAAVMRGVAAPAAPSSSGGLSLWISYGLVRPATRNDDTFANAARRDARRLASHPPPVALLRLHMSALLLFASIVFTHSNFATAVNVVEAHTRDTARSAGEFISGYSCVVTGPMRYAVSATVRRYLHVALSINTGPLLAIVGAALGRDSIAARTSASAATSCSASEKASLAAVAVAVAVGRLTRTQWRRVLCEYSCTCTPGVYEQVARTHDGERVCRHLAELYYYFTKQQFYVVGGAK